VGYGERVGEEVNSLRSEGRSNVVLYIKYKQLTNIQQGDVYRETSNMCPYGRHSNQNAAFRGLTNKTTSS
jgi:hypothetical protein